MSLRGYLDSLQSQARLLEVDEPISKTYEIAGCLKKLEPEPVLFKNVKESAFRVTGNLFCSKAAFAMYFAIPVNQIIPTLSAAIARPTPCEIVTDAACQEVVEAQPDLDCLPILRHCEQDGGNYISSGVVIARHPLYGQNADFHRCMQLSSTEMAVRVVRSRHFDTFLNDRRQLDIAICIGNAPNVLAAAATTVDLGVNELEIANSLEPLQVVKARTSDLMVPAECEFVLEGTIYLDRQHTEGPFVDLTETYDVARQQPVFVMKALTHRKDAIWHALLPGALEHKLLMGMPREPTIFQKVNQVVRCLDVNVNPGGASWLHAIVQIDKQYPDDGLKAIEAAFAGHRSCKHVFVVDEDIDIYDPLSVEWAMATRFQGDRGIVIKDKAPGSSLDPSSEPGTYLTTRIGFDLTKPLATQGKSFNKAPFPDVDLKKFLK
jgi:2,5-furandicarboxylate decarboxylase 1